MVHRIALVLLLEITPMITLIRWRIAAKKGAPVDLGRAPLLTRLTALELPLLILMVFMAAAMARAL